MPLNQPKRHIGHGLDTTGVVRRHDLRDELSKLPKGEDQAHRNAEGGNDESTSRKTRQRREDRQRYP